MLDAGGYAEAILADNPLAYYRLGEQASITAAVIEAEPNETRAEATPLPLLEDPFGSGYSASLGLGQISPSSDLDYWSFEALAGDVVSVSVDTPGSDLNPTVRLYNAAGAYLGSDDRSGPGNDSFISPYTIESSGTYFVRVNKGNTYYGGAETGDYELRLDVARGIQLESDVEYANDLITGANTLELSSVMARRTGTIAGTLMATDWQVDEDYFNLGTVQDGESILASLRLPHTSDLRPVIEIRRDDGSPTGAVVKVAPNPTETVARANITEPGTYFAVVVAFVGQGPRGQYLLDVGVVPTGDLEFADLALIEVTAPSAAMSGETVSVTWTVGNFGTGSTYIDRWYDRVVLSTDDRYGDPNDIGMAVVRHTGVLDVDGQQTTQIDVQLPVGLSGDYWLLVETDEDNRVFEYIFESKNIRQSGSGISIELTPFADLTTSDVSAPVEVLARDPITITWSATNEGAGVTGIRLDESSCAPTRQRTGLTLSTVSSTGII